MILLSVCWPNFAFPVDDSLFSPNFGKFIALQVVNCVGVFLFYTPPANSFPSVLLFSLFLFTFPSTALHNPYYYNHYGVLLALDQQSLFLFEFLPFFITFLVFILLVFNVVPFQTAFCTFQICFIFLAFCLKIRSNFPPWFAFTIPIFLINFAFFHQVAMSFPFLFFEIVGFFNFLNYLTSCQFPKFLFLAFFFFFQCQPSLLSIFV